MPDNPVDWVRSLEDREKTALLCWLACDDPGVFAELRSEASAARGGTDG